jgi:hypothetical protein
MRKSKMTCRKVSANLAELVISRRPVSAEAQEHIAVCAVCASELVSMESTMRILDEWQAPDPGPFFDARLSARLCLEKANAPAGFFERLRARVLYSSDIRVRRWAAGAVAAVLAIGGGTTIAVLNDQTQPVETSVAVRDLQWFDGNAQVIQQLSSLDSDKEGSAAASK